ncbi:mitochondrial outer membrane import complex protein METAXIN [Hordeum vulgare]|nr:mitochondrial outer membrane import complex protein METAXIN [Hordeum vulgare]
MSQVPFDIHVDSRFPDADHIPYVEFGECVAFNNENGGVIEYLREEKIVDLTSKHPSVSYSDVLPTKAMISTWLADALQYELWVANDGAHWSIARDIYFSDLPWPIGKVLYWKKIREVKQLLDITKLNAAEKEEEIYRKATAAYDALSTKLGDQSFLFDDSPTDVDALLLGHVLFVLNALPATSMLRSYLQNYDNLVKLAEDIKVQLVGVDSSAAGSASSDPPSSSTPRKTASSGQSYKPKPKAKKERTEEEKKFRRRTKYFLAAQLISVLVFLSIMGGVDSSELDDDYELEYED